MTHNCFSLPRKPKAQPQIWAPGETCGCSWLSSVVEAAAEEHDLSKWPRPSLHFQVSSGKQAGIDELKGCPFPASSSWLGAPSETIRSRSHSSLVSHVVGHPNQT